MNLIATSALTQYAEVCWDCMPLRVAIISYLVISVIFGMIIVCAGSSGSAASGDGEAILILLVIVGLFWPYYLLSWMQQRDTPAAPPAEKAASPVFAGARGFEVVPLPAVPALPAVKTVNRDCCPECGKPFAGRKPIRWRDTRVCPECREYLRVLD